jgi:hypothetical protein
MPLYKYASNRLLTLFENLLLGAKLSEYHTGFRAYTRELLEALPLEQNSNNFVFDNQVIAQAILLKARIGEISCPTKYFPEASSINLRNSFVYGLGVIQTTLLVHSTLYRRAGTASAELSRCETPAPSSKPGPQPAAGK